MNRNKRIYDMTASVNQFCQLIEKQAGRIQAPPTLVDQVYAWIESSYYTKALKNFESTKHLKEEDINALSLKAKEDIRSLLEIQKNILNRDDDYELAMKNILALVAKDNINTIDIGETGDNDVVLIKDGSAFHFSLYEMSDDQYLCRIAWDYMDSDGEEESEGNLVETLFFIKNYLYKIKEVADLLQEGIDNLTEQKTMDPSMLEFVQSKALGDGTKNFGITTDDMGMSDRLSHQEMTIKARLDIDRGANTRGYWDEPKKKGSFLGTVVINIPEAIYPDKDTRMETLFTDIKSTIRHELDHAMQSALAFLSGESNAGLPGKKIRDMRYDDLGYKNEDYKKKDDGREVALEYGESRQDHAIRDIEFAPRLNDSIEEFLKNVNNFPPELRKDFARIFIGEGDVYWFKNIVKEYEKENNTKIKYPFGWTDEFFRKLNTYQEKKWKLAVREFYKAVEPALQSTASILAEAESFEKLAGVLEPPTDLVESVMAWAESAIAYQIVNNSKKNNNDERIKRIAEGKADLLESLIYVIESQFEEERFAEQIDALFIDESLWFPGITKYDNDLIRLDFTDQQYEINVRKEDHKYSAAFYHGSNYVSGYDEYGSAKTLHEYLSSILDKLKMLFELINHGINDIDHIDYSDKEYPPLADELNTLTAQQSQGALFTIDSRTIPVHTNHVGAEELKFIVQIVPLAGDALGTWQSNPGAEPMLGYLRISYDRNLDIRTNQELETYFDSIRDTVIHELIHMMQTGIKYLGNLSEEGGLPGKDIRESKKQTGYNHLGTPQYPVQNFQRQTHPLRDIEFQTRLSDSIRAFNKVKPKMPLELQKIIAKYFVGEVPEETMNGAVFEYIKNNPDKDEPVIPYSADYFLTSLREAQPLKYEKAVKEFYKAIGL